MKNIIEYLQEAKQSFLIKGHTKQQQEISNLDRIYEKIDNEIKRVFGELDFKFGGYLKDRNVGYSYETKEAEVKINNTKLNKLFKAITSPTISIENTYGNGHNFYEIVYDFGEPLRKRWIYRLDINKSCIKKNIVKKI